MGATYLGDHIRRAPRHLLLLEPIVKALRHTVRSATRYLRYLQFSRSRKSGADSWHTSAACTTRSMSPLLAQRVFDRLVLRRLGHNEAHLPLEPDRLAPLMLGLVRP